jgi:hypothetical protein
VLEDRLVKCFQLCRDGRGRVASAKRIAPPVKRSEQIYTAANAYLNPACRYRNRALAEPIDKDMSIECDDTSVDAECCCCACHIEAGSCGARTVGASLTKQLRHVRDAQGF